jgi:hypothetical protein
MTAVIALPVETALDTRLSPQARAALVIGLAFTPEDLPHPVLPFFNGMGIPRRAVYRVLFELEAHGYLARARVATGVGKRGGSRYRYEFRSRPAPCGSCD